MNTEEVAKKVVDLTRKQAWHEAVDKLYDKDIVSVEAYSAGGGSPDASLGVSRAGAAPVGLESS